MKKITRSVINFNEIPKEFHSNKIFDGYKKNTYGIFHINDDEDCELTVWLKIKYPTIKRKQSFLIYFEN